MKQISFASATYDNKKIMTKRERFLTEMDTVIPWPRLLKLIEPCYPKKGKGRPPMPMESMLRIYFLQQWYSLSDPAAEEALYDIESMRRFAQLELVVDALPDETTILNFRRMVEKHQLSEVLFNDINAYLVERGIAVSQGSMVDATIISASGSTKNKDKARDPDMHSTRKNNQYFFGMKIHIGTDVNSNAIHSATVTAANVADITELPNLLRVDDKVIFADAGYTSDSYKRGSRALGLSWKVNDKRKVNEEHELNTK
jgi:IS5 family transposase